MLFACLDYLQYRFHVGRYSAQQLSAAGGFLADGSSLKRLDGIRDGDIIGCHPIDSLVGWAVMYIQDYPFSHVGLLTKERTVVETTLSGTIERSAASYFDGKHYLRIVRREGMYATSEEGVIAAARSRIGGAYDWSGAIYVGLVALAGGHPHYRVRHSLDILVTLGGLAFLLWRFPTLSCWSVGALAVGYTVIVSVNRLRQRHILRLNGWTGKY